MDTDRYMQRICSIIAKAQITNGGPVILFQPENEYTNFETGRSPDGDYMQHIIDLARQAGIVVPMISNDARPEGHNSPGTGAGAVDIYGHDGYPLGFDCGDPDAWPADRLPTRYHALHMAQSPETPFSLLEFQGGSFDPWGGHGFEKCAALVNHEYERVFYKNNLAAGVSIFSIYMLFGGTNWGNLGHPGGYTSYDYGAAIKEDRSVAREKFLELKLQAQFVKVSPTYLTAMPGNVDFHRFTQLEIIGVDAQVTRLEINGKPLDFKQNSLSNWVAQTPDSGNTVGVPELSALEWTRLDSLPEIQPAYDDSTWPVANLVTSYNTDFSLLTPVSLFASDYGFHTGTIVFRGHFVANGRENMFNITTQGGSGFASSVWLNSTFVGSFANGPSAASHNTSSYRLPDLDAGLTYIFTILVDTMGLEENFIIGSDTMKTPRGILDYSITSPDGRRTNVTNWKLTGNLGGEDYADLSRGPLNEGGLFFERQGCHLPNASGCALSYSVLLNDRIDPGVFFYRATLPLNLPSLDLDISLSFVFNDGVSDVTFGTFRALLYVNGFQFGKYASNVGPQTNFPVPEGILRYREDNYLGLAIWPLEKRGAKLPGFRLRVNGIPVTTGRQKVDAIQGRAAYTRETSSFAL
ncbi:putative beta-galactosidase A [Colletotrichum orbiculare MAFF 240422]|uniref:Beta-galactosidase n=1 Tax=Colletotrichum orbiculare (strain 104-T / ATCC 96160 / CBS 514.97 / LARS 414 / MAFF 240422) TaxID=1213857 RepID=A0A484FYH7_COLOR|nr:putative beta-galactosidase A [Colletotrichum orbiculare MAFF 240422]